MPSTPPPGAVVLLGMVGAALVTLSGYAIYRLIHGRQDEDSRTAPTEAQAAYMRDARVRTLKSLEREARWHRVRKEVSEGADAHIPGGPSAQATGSY